MPPPPVVSALPTVESSPQEQRHGFGVNPEMLLTMAPQPPQAPSSLRSQFNFNSAPLEATGAAAGAAAAAAVSDSARAAGPAGVAGASYIPSLHFAGTRPGYVFKLGDKGMGYYRDEASAMVPLTTTMLKSSAATASVEIAELQNSLNTLKGSLVDLKASVAAQKASAEPPPPPPPPLSSPVTKLAVTAASRYQRANDLLPKTVVRAIFGVFFGIDPLLTL